MDRIWPRYATAPQRIGGTRDGLRGALWYPTLRKEREGWGTGGWFGDGAQKVLLFSVLRL
jgi:hypothetical protein